MLSTTKIFRLPDVSLHGTLHASDDSLETKSDVDYTQDYCTCIATPGTELVGVAS